MKRDFFNPETHFAAPPPAPLRHVDLPVGCSFVPAGKVVIRCANFPECRCGEDCIDPPLPDSKAARYVLIGLMIATAALGVGLLYVGLR